MKLPRFKVRTLLIAVPIVALLLEIGGLGQRSRFYARKAREAADREQSDIQIAHDAKIYLAESLKEADRIEAKEPARAAGLRVNAERLTRGIPYLEREAIRAARAKVTYERAMTHPWEGDPAIDDSLDKTPPIGPP
jgi:hypothetical protein